MHRTVCALVFAICASCIPSDVAARDTVRALAQIAAMTSHPEHEIDILEAKLAIDRMVDPAIDAERVRRKIDELTAALRGRIPAGATNDQKLQGMLELLYKPGKWNGGQDYAYDFDDPLGSNTRNKLLSHYLATRRGNCITMPTLLVILGHRIGLPITLSTAPRHVMAKYRSDAGTWVNVEATSGGFRLDSSYQRDLEIGPIAMQRGTYLRPLTRSESVGVLLEVIAQDRHQRGDFVAVNASTSYAMHLYRDNVSALLSQRLSLQRMADQLRARFVVPSNLPPHEYALFVQMEQGFRQIDRRLQDLGWTPSSPGAEKRYRALIEAARKAGH